MADDFDDVEAMLEAPFRVDTEVRECCKLRLSTS